MSEARKFIAVETVALVALVAVASAMAAYTGISSMQPNSILSPSSGVFVGFFYTLIIGAPFVLLLGAPAYWFLLRRGQAQWSTVIALGVAPGLVLLFVAKDLGVLSIGCGAAVALITHWVCCKLALTHALRPTVK